MRKLLVTGGAGFIGCNFVHYWLGAHRTDRLVVLDALTYAGSRTSLAALESNPGFRFVHGDICDAELVANTLREEGIDTIVHFAAESHVDRSISGPAAFIHTNVVGTLTLLEAARRVWLDERAVAAHRFHHVSTDEVYGSLGPDDPAFLETTQYAPNSPYAASKAGSDHLVRAYHHTFGLQVTTSNCSNNYGPYHFPEKLIPLTIVNMLRGRPIPIYGDGRNVRDWLHVSDHCRALERILENGRVGEVYNIGGRAETENLNLVRTLCQVAEQVLDERPELRARYSACPARLEGLMQFVKDRLGHDRRYGIDCGKLERELGFTPSVQLADGLRDTFTWFADNEPWWKPKLTQG
jgi:dTDP-glucose 4,6-dehydratase